MDNSGASIPSSAMFYGEILDLTHDCLLLTDLNTNLIVYANKACESTYGYSQEEFIGMPVSQISADDDHKRAIYIQKVIKKAPESQRMLTMHVCKNGRQFPVEVIAKLIEINGRRYLLSHNTDITRNTKLQSRINNIIRNLSQQAYRDYLTGAYNRAYLYNVCLPRLIGCKVGVLVIDIDRFKSINERYGHEGGDLVLQMIVKFINSSLRRRDKVFRYGGDEFVIILTNPDCAEIEEVAQRIADVIASTPIVYNQGKVLCTVSIGKAKGYIVEDNDLDNLIRAADNELMKLKNLRPQK